MKYIIYLFIFIIMLFASFLTAKFLDSKFDFELSSWLQAVGVIFSVIVGFMVTIWEINHQRRKTDERVHIVYSLTYFAIDSVCDRLNNALKKVGNARLQKRRTAEAIKTIQNIHTVYVKIEFVESFNKIRSNLVAINEGIDKGRKHQDLGIRSGKLESSIKVLVKTEQLWNEFNTVAKSFDFKPLPFPASEYKILKERIKVHKIKNQ